jgi:hypothetical protein
MLYVSGYLKVSNSFLLFTNIADSAIICSVPGKYRKLCLISGICLNKIGALHSAQKNNYSYFLDTESWRASQVNHFPNMSSSSSSEGTSSGNRKFDMKYSSDLNNHY